jgi:GDP/UDP-N,N'-diacetylbacillosamine 2-epimerase (hydrolysing)
LVKKRIAFCTGTRAEYGLLKPLMDRIIADDTLEFELYVTGMHLSPEFGNTVSLIEADGVPVTDRVEMLLSGDTPSAISKSMGLAMIGFGDVLARRKPDMLVILGDRFEAFCAAAAATVACIPIAHLHGGELTEGAIDDAFRHSITKMSHLHFTSTEEYRRRVIRMGEDPVRVFNVGAIGIENLRKLPLLDRMELLQELGTDPGRQIALVTFHPATIDPEPADAQMKKLLEALDDEPSLFIVFTKANADTHGRSINALIDEFVRMNSGRAIAFTSMGQLRYLSAMRAASVVIGNSSSGIIEAPSFGIPSVNIGNRQKGRARAESVIDCLPTREAIRKAIHTALSESFRQLAGGVANPYEGHGVTDRILHEIRAYVTAAHGPKSFYQGTAV